MMTVDELELRQEIQELKAQQNRVAQILDQLDRRMCALEGKDVLPIAESNAQDEPGQCSPHRMKFDGSHFGCGTVKRYKFKCTLCNQAEIFYQRCELQSEYYQALAVLGLL